MDLIHCHVPGNPGSEQTADILNPIARRYGVLVKIVRVSHNRELASSEGVRDVRIFRDGREVDRFAGLPPESEVRQRLEIHTKGLPDHAAETGEAQPATTQPIVQPMSKDWLAPGIQRL